MNDSEDTENPDSKGNGLMSDKDQVFQYGEVDLRITLFSQFLRDETSSSCPMIAPLGFHKTNP